jgi:hypothetical protein
MSLCNVPDLNAQDLKQVTCWLLYPSLTRTDTKTAAKVYEMKNGNLLKIALLSANGMAFIPVVIVV